MYKLLLVTDRDDLLLLFHDKIDWKRLNCNVPLTATSPEEAIRLANTNAVDAVGYRFFDINGMELTKFLRYVRPSLPIFQICDGVPDQTAVIRQTVSVLDRLHTDYADETYDEEAMLTIHRDEMVHDLLAGKIGDWDALVREMKLVRTHVSLDEPCVLYEIDMPQGDVFLSEHRGHAQQRLESALRNNFFGRYVEGVYYAVAVLTPRNIRVVCMPMHGEEPQPRDVLGKRTEHHVQESIRKIKDYLDLDMTVTRCEWLSSVKDLLRTAQEA